MKKRIHELAVQIEFPMDYENPAWAYEQSIYEFAELIVKECVQISLKNSHRNDDMGAIIARQIQKHFGVEA